MKGIFITFEAKLYRSIKVSHLRSLRDRTQLLHGQT